MTSPDKWEALRDIRGPADEVVLAIRSEIAGGGADSWPVVEERRAKGTSSQAVIVRECPTGPGSGRKVVEKVIGPGDLPGVDGWLDEPLFYARLADRVRVPGLKVPTLYAVEAPSREDVRLHLEFCEGFRTLRGLSDRTRAAEVFGRFAARSRELALYEQDWLHQSTGVGLHQPPGPFARLLDQVLDGAARDQVATSFDDLFRQRTEVNLAYRARGLPCLTHGDASHLNVLVGDGGRDTILAVDWARVASGRVGDDLARLTLPWLLTGAGVRNETELLELESELFERYLAGFGRPDEAARVRHCYDVKSVVLVMAIGRHLSDWLERAGAAERPERRDVLRVLLETMARRAGQVTTGATTTTITENHMTDEQRRLTERYTGPVAASYNKVRSGSPRWQKEDSAVRDMLADYRGATVLDLPVGTGRFIPLYRDLGCPWVGLDISEQMLDQARSEAAALGHDAERLDVADAVTMERDDVAVDVAIAVRFFNWLSSDRAGRAFANIAATASQAMIVSLTTIDLAGIPPSRRSRRAASLEDRQPGPDGTPPNGPHRWDHFQSWVLAAGMEVARSTMVFETERGLRNHIHLLRRLRD